MIALEWLDPPFVGGHWVPEMVELAGGVDVAGTARREVARRSPGSTSTRSRPTSSSSMPCGWYVEESRAQAEEHRERIAALGAPRVFAVDAASTYSRPGPRLVDGVELLAHLFHPDRVEAPAGIGSASAGSARGARPPIHGSGPARASRRATRAAAASATAVSGAVTGSSVAAEPAHRRRDRVGQGGRRVAALEHRADRGADRAPSSRVRGRHLAEVLAGQGQPGERVVAVGVEAGRDQDQVGGEFAGDRGDDAVEQREEDVAARALRHRQVDREALAAARRRRRSASAGPRPDPLLLDR